MVYGYVHTAAIGQLSRYVRDCEAGPDDKAPEVNLWEGNADEEAHPLVLELNSYDKNGVSAALAYMAEGSERDAPALIRWMMGGGFKGHFESEAAFCEDQFSSALTNHFEQWAGRADVGFPDSGDFIECIDWDEVARQTFEVWEDVFTSVEDDAGVYVFDISININDYREED